MVDQQKIFGDLVLKSVGKSCVNLRSALGTV